MSPHLQKNDIFSTQTVQPYTQYKDNVKPKELLLIANYLYRLLEEDYVL